MIDKSKHSTKEELFAFLRENKKELRAEKMFQMKQADSVSYVVPLYDTKGVAIKAESQQTLINKDSIMAKIVINTTNLMDSHDDVHIPGLWKKSIKDNKSVYHLQEHQMKFDKIITDDVKVSTKSMSWKDLGFDYEGETEALIFDSTIPKERNPFMFEQYAKGYVKEHSVGMRYVQLFLCLNSSDKWDVEEKANWDKYYEYVTNKDDVDNQGYFWAVTEAKLVEGSAVVKGSNHATPTISVKENIVEPSTDTQQEDKDSRQTDTISAKEFRNLLFN
jgi:hypothetical protein